MLEPCTEQGRVSRLCAMNAVLLLPSPVCTLYARQGNANTNWIPMLMLLMSFLLGQGVHGLEYQYPLRGSDLPKAPAKMPKLSPKEAPICPQLVQQDKWSTCAHVPHWKIAATHHLLLAHAGQTKSWLARASRVEKSI